MKLEGNEYKEFAEKRAKKSPLIRDVLRSFFYGGAICAFSEGLKMLYEKYLPAKEAGMMVSVTLIFAAILLTGLGIFDKIGKRAGAGTLVPITGFANAMSAAAIDAKSEGYILGVGAKLFTVAGPVITYGISAGVVYGIIYWIIKTVTGG